MDNNNQKGSNTIHFTNDDYNHHNNSTNEDADGYTINRIIEQNAHTIQNTNINELTISKLIERNQLSVLGGAGKNRVMGQKINRELNATARAVERNQLTIHSLQGNDGINFIDSPTVKRKDSKVKFQVYLDYFRKSTGMTITFLTILSFILIAITKIVSDWWLTKLVGTNENSNYGVLLGVYGALVGTILIGVFLRGAFFAWVVMPISAVVLIAIIWVIIHYSKGVEKRFKALDADSKAPIFAHLSASLEGLANICVYKAQPRFDSLNLEKIDVNNKVLFAMMQVKAWQSLYIDIIASIFIYTTALFVVVFHNKNNISPSIAGLAVASALQLLIFGQWTIRSGRDVAAIMGSVQQLLYFRKNIPSEAPNIIESNRPPQNWGEPVLKSVSFHVLPREKIGIVGKTGSGKSTLLVSLLRIVELSEGQILIDNLDTSTIGLRDLRNKIAIIPQEPVIFVGTIRSNLDPFKICTDEEIWDALKAVHLGEKVKSMPDKLVTQVLENGKNFSLGQRQLFCIARALLKKTNILVLDEATSAVDPQTDLLIQDTIKKVFRDHTILTINTIMEADRILCLDEGRVVEFNTPTNLLNNPDGFFCKLVSRSGPDAAERLRSLISLHHKDKNKEFSSIKNDETITNTAVTPPPTPISPYPNMPPSLGDDKKWMDKKGCK
ncbi:10598_t:CDS:10 [Diversispora eburnea]|uniref:10598_t:CDS:1 n=1 Tax=Diversispora eburnea TaxID=1213867 RepID=A0A9N8WN14_9GLOM|nr:10598_t:CDS:10 [Diversispora eburnea]